MSQKQQICFKITTDELLNKLDEFKTDQKFKTRSDAINHILVVFFSQNDLEEKIELMLEKYMENPKFLEFIDSQIDKRLLSRATDSVSRERKTASKK